MADAIFIPGDGHFVPTENAGSPWGDHLVHGGPPAGLLARTIERFEPDSELHVSRLTIDLFRPVPKRPLAVTVRTLRAGRRIHVVEAALLADGVEICHATALLLRKSRVALPEEGRVSMPPGPEGIETSNLGRGPRGEGGAPTDGGPRRSGFHTTVEARWVTPPGESGKRFAWLRLPLPLVAGEENTPLVHVAAVSDFVNALSGGGRREGVGFINADITLYLQRLPRGEWIGLEVERAVEPHGLGVSRATLYDADGPIGTAIEAALANAMH